MGDSFQNLVARTQNLGASGDRAPVRQQPWLVLLEVLVLLELLVLLEVVVLL